MSTQPTIWPQVTPIPYQTTPQQIGFNIGELLQPLITMVIVVMMMKMMTTMMQPPKPKPRLPAELPPGYVPVGKPAMEPTIFEKVEKAVEPLWKPKPAKPVRKVRVEEEDLVAKLAGLEAKGREMAAEVGQNITFLRVEEGYQEKGAIVKWWFVDPEGNKIRAGGVEDLTWKVKRLKR